MKFKESLKKASLPLFFCIGTVYLELCFKFLTVGYTGMTDMICTTLFALSGGMFLTALSSFLSERVNRIVSIGVFFFVCLVFIGQYVHYLFYSSVFSIYSMLNGGQVFAFAGSIFKIMVDHWWQNLLLFLPFLLRLILLKWIDTPKRTALGAATLLAALCLVIFVPFTFDKTSEDRYSYYHLYHDIHAPLFSICSFGLGETMLIDVNRSVFGFEETEIVLPEQQPSDPEELPEEVSYHVMEIDFDTLITSAESETIAEMHRYFAGVSPTAENEFTGIFEGKNLIVVVAESFSEAAVDPVLTPTLYRMSQEGFTFTNFYNPVYYVSTYDGEYVSLLSRLPKEGCWSMYWTKDNYEPFSYGNLFGALGYKTTAYHNGEYNYYSRDESHPNLGYEWIAEGNGLQITNTWPESDVEMIQNTVLDYAGSEPFMTYYLTISGHLNYNFSSNYYNGNAMANKHYEAVKDLPYSEPVRAYLATQIELDHAMELLLQMLEEQGVLEDTVIVISPDHYPYGLTEEEMAELYPDMQYPNFEIHRGALIIYNSETDGVTVTKHASNLDILPTVLNLFGVEYDSRLLMGRDLLSDEEGLVIFNDRSWMTDFGLYDAVSGIFTPFEESVPDDAYVDRINTEVYYRYLISRRILDLDYYSILFDQ